MCDLILYFQQKARSNGVDVAYKNSTGSGRYDKLEEQDFLF